MNDRMKDTLEEGIADSAGADKISRDEKRDAAYFLEKIDQISRDTEYLREAVNQILNQGGRPEAAAAVGQIVSAREQTNQMLIDFYQKAYFDLIYAPRKISEEVADSLRRQNMLNTLLDMIDETADRDTKKTLLEILHEMIADCRNGAGKP